MKKIRDIWANNREKKRQTRPGRFWCRNCDCELVAEGETCPNCKYKDKKHFRQPFQRKT